MGVCFFRQPRTHLPRSLLASPPEFSRKQVNALVRDGDMRRSSQLAACEWPFGDVVPPLYAAFAFLVRARIRDSAIYPSVIYSSLARDSSREIHQKLLDFAVTYRWMNDLY